MVYAQFIPNSVFQIIFKLQSVHADYNDKFERYNANL